MTQLQPTLFDYIARVDFMDDSELKKFNVDSKFNIKIQQHLLDRGAKLLIGPRGAGKTHQMRLAHLRAMIDENKPFTVFTTFNRYIFLEPLIKKSSSARKVFHTWVLLQILNSCIDSLRENGGEVGDFIVDFPVEIADITNFIAEAEKGVIPGNTKILTSINLDFLKKKLSEAAALSSRRRTVILMDDAAISLSGEYFDEFLDIFQGIKSVNITPKASVYPGTEYFGSRFSLRHDAEPVYAWMNPDDDDFESSMLQIAKARFSLDENLDEIIKYLAYASFGIPRSMLSMLNTYIQNPPTKRKPLISTINNILQEHVSLITTDLYSLRKKYPQYASMITEANSMFMLIVDDLAKVNEELDDSKQLTLGVNVDAEYQSPTIQKIFSFLMEAGHLYPETSVKHGKVASGKPREYDRYLIHPAFLMQRGVFKRGRMMNIRQELSLLSSKGEKHPIRKSVNSLFKDKSLLKLDLPKCQSCGAERLSDSQRFCGNCGTRLVEKSVFEECMSTSINDLPLTDWEKGKIEEYTHLKTIADVISSQDPKGNLRVAPGIGPIKSTKIIERVQSFITEVLV